MPESTVESVVRSETLDRTDATLHSVRYARAADPTLKPSNAMSPTIHESESSPKTVQFESLARSRTEVWIETGGKVYRLRKTRQGKLILTK
ncbi:MAG: hemin uptake protein HemP [Planctomycetota bacterium]